MNQSELINADRYNPNHMLDSLTAIIGVKNDIGLARKLKVSEQVISKMREGKISVSASMMMWLHEASGLSVQELRQLLGDRRAKCRMTCNWISARSKIGE